MYSGLKLIFVLYILNKSTNTQITNNTGVCTVDPLTCCESYRRKGQECEECFPGTFGKNCESICPDGFYGRLCKGNCSCSSCDKISGTCQTNISDTTGDTTGEEDDWTNVILFSSGIIGICFSVGVLSYYQMRESKNFTQSDSRGENEIQSEVQESSETSVPYSFMESEGNGKNKTLSKELESHHFSKGHETFGSSSSKICFKEEKLTSQACIASKEVVNLSSTFEDVYSYLNMDTSPYNTLNLTSKSDIEFDDEIHTEDLKKMTSTDENIYNKSVSIHRLSFPYPENSISHENISTKEDFENLLNDITALENPSESVKLNIHTPKDLSDSLTRKKSPKSSTRETQERKVHLEEMSTMLENFKPKINEVESNDSKTNIIHRQRSSKKTKKKLLRYSFAPSPEII